MSEHLRAIRRKLDDLRRKGLRLHGYLGRADGTITQDGVPGHQWVRIELPGSNVAEALLKGNARPIGNLPVIVEYDAVLKELVIADVDAPRLPTPGSGEGTVPWNVQLHGWTHARGYEDVIEALSSNQIWQNRVQPHASDTQSVVVQGGGYYAGENFVYRSTYAEVDLSSYYPGSGLLWVLLYLDAAGAVGVQDDGATALGELLPPPADTYVVAAVRLQAGVAMSWDEIVDLRFCSQPQTGESGGSDVLAWLGW